MHVSPGACRGKKRVLALLELGLQEVVHFLLLILGIKLGFSTGTVLTFNCWAIFPGPNGRDLISAEECKQVHCL